MKAFRWKRRNISLSEYERIMGINSSNGVQGTKGQSNSKKLRQAYKMAAEVRKFEIGLFWKRATFFWAFIVAVYTAYFNVLVKVYPAVKSEQPPYQHGTAPLLVLSALGLFFCFSWLLSSYGSKHWQENWENHLDLLEDSVTGPLYKIYEAGKAFSETKLTIAAGWAVTVCAYGLLIFEFSALVKCRIAESGAVPFAIVLVFSLSIALCMCLFSKVMRGNQSNSGAFDFQIKEY